jgi:hypothetical protein
VSRFIPLHHSVQMSMPDADFLPGNPSFECEQEKFLLSTEFRHNELAEFQCTGRNVTVGDPPYA